jgi:RNA polymerase sigma-70 factor (ECF subfamily)
MPLEQTPDWNAIAETHGPHVFRIAFRIVGSVHDAEDIAQDVFVEALELFRSTRVRSWRGLLVRLATLRSIDRLRRRRPCHVLSEGDHVSTVSPFDEAEAIELAERLRQAIAHLPEQQAAVFTLIAFEQLSRDEVAASLNISPEAVSTALYKARQRLAAELNVLKTGDNR